MEDLAAWHGVERWVLTALGSGNGGAQQPKAWRRGRHFVLWAPAPSSPRARNPFPPSAGSLPASSFFLHPGFTAAKTRSSAQSQQVGGTCRNPLSQPSIKATRHSPAFGNHLLFTPAPAHEAKPKTKRRQLSWGRPYEKLQEHFENRVHRGKGPRYIQRSALHAGRQISCAVDSYLR